MQTFVPDPFSFPACARVLDRQRLGKQRVEAHQILNALAGNTAGWVNHPATNMWRGYEPALRQYLRAMIVEWTSRGYLNTMHTPALHRNIKMPYWWGDEKVHSSHRASLLHKDYEWYKQFNWAEKPELNYVWPNPPYTLYKK